MLTIQIFVLEFYGQVQNNFTIHLYLNYFVTNHSYLSGISSSSSSKRVRDVHKKLMFQNHPDRGGSPYLAAKINEAKDYLEKQSKR